MKKFLLFLALLVCVVVTEFFCLEAKDTITFRENTDVQMEDAVTIGALEAANESTDIVWEDTGTYKKVDITRSDSGAEETSAEESEAETSADSEASEE